MNLKELDLETILGRCREIAADAHAKVENDMARLVREIREALYINFFTGENLLDDAAVNLEPGTTYRLTLILEKVES